MFAVTNLRCSPQKYCNPEQLIDETLHHNVLGAELIVFKILPLLSNWHIFLINIQDTDPRY